MTERMKVERLARPAELMTDKVESLKRATEFSKYADLEKTSVHEERGLIKYLLYNQDVLSFGVDGREKFIESIQSLKIGRERKGADLILKIIDRFGYVPEDMAYDLLIPYMQRRKKLDSALHFMSYKRARSIADLFIGEGTLKQELWEPRTPKHFEYWVWWELKNKAISPKWPFNTNHENKAWSPSYVMYRYGKDTTFIEQHRNDIERVMDKFIAQLTNFGYEKEGVERFLKCGLTADWLFTFEILPTRGLSMITQHPKDWMTKEVLKEYSTIDLPKDGSVETWKTNIEYSKQNNIHFKDNTAILMVDPKSIMNTHIFSVQKRIDFNKFLKVFRVDPDRIKENYRFCVEENIPFKECLQLLILPPDELQENYKLYLQFKDKVNPSNYPYLLTKKTEQLKKRFGVE